MIVLIGGTKGGSGKSTIATNLVVLNSLAGRDTLLIDGDEQGSCHKFSLLRAEELGGHPGYTIAQIFGPAILQQTPSLSKRFDDIFIDVGGTERDTTALRSGLAAAHIAIVPCAPSLFDVWTFDTVAQTIREASQINPKLKAYGFLNKADPPNQGEDNADTIAEIHEADGIEYLDTPVVMRKSFRHAAKRGRGVVEIPEVPELRRKGDPSAAMAEIKALYQGVLQQPVNTKEESVNNGIC